jgi:hypothetical protein
MTQHGSSKCRNRVYACSKAEEAEPSPLKNTAIISAATEAEAAEEAAVVAAART